MICFARASSGRAPSAFFASATSASYPLPGAEDRGETS